MSVAAAPSIFDVFNARQLTPEEVAKTFVPPPHFAQLAMPTHTLIVGPRGSGKTTLLKMLHPAALAAWRHTRASHFRDQINFTGVFIATDINWNEQVRALGEGRLDSQSQQQFIKAAFVTQILQSLVESMAYRAGRLGLQKEASHRQVALSEGDEEEICDHIILSWQLEKTIPTFEGIRFALARRLSQIQSFASQEASRSTEGRGDRIAAIEFLHLDFLASAAVAVELYNSKVHEPNGKWALLFDELELAPAWIRVVLVRFLRSVDARFLFKISLSPYSVDLKRELTNTNSAGADQDFQLIRLWYVNKEQGYPFCEELLRGMLHAKGLASRDATEIFGASAFSTTEEEWRSHGTAYHAGSRLSIQFKQLAARDPTFRDYLRKRGINIGQLEAVESNKRAADLRKARSIVALRNYFRGEGKDLFRSRAQGRRSRKVPTIFGGATSLFAMMEGNPRWFIGIVGHLLNQYAELQQVPRPAQVRAVLNAANIFRAMLKTIPCGPVGRSQRGLLALLDPVGEYFAHAAIDAPFDPDPPCSFIVDSKASDDEIRAMGAALNAGAIIYAPSEGDLGILESVRGKRFRIWYILAPHYFVPLVLGRPMSLHEIIRRADKELSNKTPEPTLFAPSERNDG